MEVGATELRLFFKFGGKSATRVRLC